MLRVLPWVRSVTAASPQSTWHGSRMTEGTRVSFSFLCPGRLLLTSSTLDLNSTIEMAPRTQPKVYSVLQARVKVTFGLVDSTTPSSSLPKQLDLEIEIHARNVMEN